MAKGGGGGGGGIKAIFGTAKADLLFGDHVGGDTLYGLGGNDTIRALGGTNFLYGGDGDDSVFGAGGNDQINGGLGNDLLDGGLGADMANYADATGGVTVNLSLTTAQNTGSAGIDTLRNFEGIYGSAFNDVLTASAVGNVIFGFAGDDVVNGNGGRDTLYGGIGNDTVNGGAGNDYITSDEFGLIGNDVINGGLGADTIDYSFAADAITVDLTLTTAQNTGGGGIDTLVGIENINGTQQADRLTGNAAANVILASGGDDTVIGAAGNDVLDGFAGSDQLFGGLGNDTLYGGPSGFSTDVDRLTGGAGADSFAFDNAFFSTTAGTDQITDFSHAEGDVIDLRAMGLSAAGFVGAGPFTGVAGQMQVVTVGSHQWVQTDLDGNGTADGLVIDVVSATALVAADFLF